MTLFRFRGQVIASVVALVLSSCSDGAGDRNISQPPSETSTKTALIEEGQAAYNMYCVGCHGENGDGNGLAARFLSPRPRNFQTAKFKFSSTRSGSLPSDDDLRRTIVEGLKGSAMPGWDMLPTQTVVALIAHIKTFSPRWNQKPPTETPTSPTAPTAISIVDDPYHPLADKFATIARGRAVYHGYATCWTCHPSYASEDDMTAYLVAMDNAGNAGFRPNLKQSEATPNEEGELIFPPDFRRDFVKSGGQVDDLYRSIAMGISGTAMPTWLDSIASHRTSDPSQMVTDAADLWAMAYYVQSLLMERPARLNPASVVIRARPQRIYAEGEAFVPIRETEPTTTGEEYEGDN